VSPGRGTYSPTTGFPLRKGRNSFRPWSGHVARSTVAGTAVTGTGPAEWQSAGRAALVAAARVAPAWRPEAAALAAGTITATRATRATKAFPGPIFENLSVTVSSQSVARARTQRSRGCGSE